MIKQVPCSISIGQLKNEVDSIYAGLLLVENKCNEVLGSELPRNLTDEQYRALSSLHRALLHEHCDFFLACHHPMATSGLRSLPASYGMPQRFWHCGVVNYIELLRRNMPESEEHLIAFIHLAYPLVSGLSEMIPSFRGFWLKCLNELLCYR
ncbi:hypothetical protein BX600DRAFT_385409 [Xylariales sp. PMI_506]|nr:hypothetical protein BX600DRAFT_385409 [Xylariales sp. PMI_506]